MGGGASTVQLPAWKPALGFFGGVASPAGLCSEKEAVLVLAGVYSTRDTGISIRMTNLCASCVFIRVTKHDNKYCVTVVTQVLLHIRTS